MDQAQDEIPDAGRPSTWVKYKKGMCTGCRAQCCQLPVEVSAIDLIRLGWATEEEISVSFEKTARRLMREKKLQAYIASSQVFVLAQRPNGDCINLGARTRLCGVYEKRPEVCRGFPTTLGPKPGWCPATPAKKN